MIKEFHESQNISPISDFTNTTTDTRTTLSLFIRLYNGAKSLGEIAYDITATGIQTINSVVVTSTPITRIYIKHNGIRQDIPILDINADFPNGQFWFTANYISINPTVVGGIQLSNMMLNRGPSALPYEPYGSTWNTKSYAKSISGSQTYVKFPIVLRTNQQSISTWSVKGNMVQNGTPTPTSPITPSECGERTKNLLDKSTFVVGKWISDRGVISDNVDGALTTQKINVQVNETYTIKNYVTDGISISGIAIGIYDSNDNFSRRVFSTNSETSFTIESGESYFIVGIAKLGVSQSDINSVKLIVNTGSAAFSYEPYGYKIPIVSGGVTTNVYLNEPLRKIGDYADTITTDGTVLRRIKKIVLTGQESWTRGSDYTFYIKSVNDYLHIKDIICVSSHYVAQINVDSGDLIDYGTCCFYYGVDEHEADIYVLYLKNITAYSTVEDFKAFLAAQYSAGTPVTVWYILSTPTTESTTTSAIPTTSGINTIDVGTSLKPSEMSLTYDGYKLCKGQRYTPLLHDNPLCGIDTYKDTLNLTTGACTRNIKKIVFDGSQTIYSCVPTADSQNYCCVFRYADIGMNDIVDFDLAMAGISYPQFITDRFVAKPISQRSLYEDISSGEYGANTMTAKNRYVIFCVSGLTTSEEYTQWFTNNPTTLYYILATSTTETITVPTGLSGTEEGYLTQSSTPTPTNPVYPISRTRCAI